MTTTISPAQQCRAVIYKKTNATSESDDPVYYNKFHSSKIVIEILYLHISIFCTFIDVAFMLH